jgi:transcriptional regulator
VTIEAGARRADTSLPENDMTKKALSLMKGTLDLLILKTLSLGPLHGYEISKWIERKTGDAIHIEYGALYQSLLRMEGKGWLEAEWRQSPTGREVRFYELTALGREQLEQQSESWDLYVTAMYSVLRTAESGS